jgi:hypothetical protein
MCFRFSPKRRRAALPLLSTVLPLLAIACQSPDVAPSAPGGAAAPPQAPPPQPPVKLVEGLGPVHHPVSTAVPEAQKFFDQGLAYLYAFNHNEADRSFAKAAELDPKLAMAWWGRALALGPNYNLPEIDEAAAKAAYDAGQRRAHRGDRAAAGRRLRRVLTSSRWTWLAVALLSGMRWH